MMRKLHPSDLASLMAIEQTVHVTPWTEDTFRTCFIAGHSGWVMEVAQTVVGFIMATFHADECHILNLCVSRPYQRQGYGRQLLEKALQHARSKGIGVVYLEVRKSNTQAIALYEKMQFQRVAERKGYYPTVAGNEDALIFAKALNSC